jgi:hypothetical protein
MKGESKMNEKEKEIILEGIEDIIANLRHSCQTEARNQEPKKLTLHQINAVIDRQIKRVETSGMPTRFKEENTFNEFQWTVIRDLIVVYLRAIRLDFGT